MLFFIITACTPLAVIIKHSLASQRASVQKLSNSIPLLLCAGISQTVGHIVPIEGHRTEIRRERAVCPAWVAIGVGDLPASVRGPLPIAHHLREREHSTPDRRMTAQKSQ